ncbi:uncharacterized protein LOC123658195 [Melitaea cinxia]|uniref:uncharacterized protein LOC123658195 n=1 Tax=Melitaea cinxia TaxID=113334 RepID=UPI001E2719FC|nr:uncharacterized protein LOC123658195 [Melitaea cinxia]
MTESYFCENGVKTSAQVYQETILEKQDLAPGHKARSTQSWLETNVLDFRAEDWSSSSSDLNLLDYDLWSVLENMACSKCHYNLGFLKQSIQLAVKNFPMESVCFY